MKKNIMGAFCALALLFGFAGSVSAQGSLPIALQQVSDQNGKPIVGALLYFYQVGTVATRQDSFQDTGLTNANQWPLQSDAYGRIPMFYVASGSIHVRLTDPGGLVIFDYPNMLVIGPSGGGGGGSGTVDPTGVASTGDMKFRPSSEVLTGWVRMNGNTIGNSVSGATERANADTQALFIYLWGLGLIPSGGRGANGLADFNASKTMPTIDMRGMAPVGLDTMGAAAAGRLNGALFTAGNSSTPLSTGGEATHTITQAQLPVVNPTWSQTGGSAGWSQTGGSASWAQSGTGTALFHGNSVTPTLNNAVGVINNQSGGSTIGSPGGTTAVNQQTITVSAFTPSGSVDTVSVAGTVNSVSVTGNVTGLSVTGNVTGFGSGAVMNVMNPFILGTWFLKL
jgi:hypothetical protein